MPSGKCNLFEVVFGSDWHICQEASEPCVWITEETTMTVVWWGSRAISIFSFPRHWAPMLRMLTPRSMGALFWILEFGSQFRTVPVYSPPGSSVLGLLSLRISGTSLTVPLPFCGHWIQDLIHSPSHGLLSRVLTSLAGMDMNIFWLNTFLYWSRVPYIGIAT